MCCLFGLFDIKQSLSPTEKSRVLSILGTYCESRGIDATGYAYNHRGKLTIRKEAIPAHKMTFDIPTDANLIMGHTRMTTQGSALHAKNNHPFLGRLPHNRFALAHNGILSNDQVLRKSERLPKTEIETDSYVAVQLIVAKLMATARKLVLNDFAFPACTQSDLLKSQWWDPIPGLCNFLAEECLFSDEYRTWSRDLFSAYCKYCDLHDLEKPRTDQSFLVALKEAHPELRSDRWAECGVQGRGFTGIRLRKPRSQDTINKPVFQVHQS